MEAQWPWPMLRHSRRWVPVPVAGLHKSCSVRRATPYAFCYRHNGGSKCSVPGCTTATKARGMCGRHGNKRCSHPGCTTATQADCSGLCNRHGGGYRCVMPGCTKNVSRNNRCIRHQLVPARAATPYRSLAEYAKGTAACPARNQGVQHSLGPTVGAFAMEEADASCLAAPHAHFGVGSASSTCWTWHQLSLGPHPHPSLLTLWQLLLPRHAPTGSPDELTPHTKANVIRGVGLTPMQRMQALTSTPQYSGPEVLNMRQRARHVQRTGVVTQPRTHVTPALVTAPVEEYQLIVNGFSIRVSDAPGSLS